MTIEIPPPGMRVYRSESEDAKLARFSTEAPRVPWDVFRKTILRWKSGEHFGLIGPTGLGKTTMLVNVLPLHPYAVAFATKPRDETMEYLIQHEGYLKLERWRSLDPDDYPRRVLWPDATDIDSDEVQRAVFKKAFAKIYREGGWTVAVDETWWIDNVLKLKKSIQAFLLQARSLNISLVTATQRPAWVPREIYTSSTHLMFWRTNDEKDLKSISGIGWRSARLIKEVVSELDMYQCLYVNTRTGQMARTRCPEVAFESKPRNGRGGKP